MLNPASAYFDEGFPHLERLNRLSQVMTEASNSVGTRPSAVRTMNVEEPLG